MNIQISLRLDVVVSISLIVPCLSPSISWPKIKQVTMVWRKKGAMLLIHCRLDEDEIGEGKSIVMRGE